MIELIDVSFAYEGGENALNHVSLRFEEGKCYCIQGPNGCGKSTLFRILCGLSFPSSGQYLLDGEEVTEKKLRDKKAAADFHRRIGFLFQNAEVQLFTRSVEDEIAFGLWQMGLPEAEVRARTEKYISLLELSNVRKRAPFNLSGGEKKRCAFASVLAMDPPILIMDEPISGLDENGQKWVMDFIRSIDKPSKSIIIASHNAEIARNVADVIVPMTSRHSLKTPENST